MKTLTTYTITEAATIINKNKVMQQKFNELKDYYKNGELDCGFKCGNFFNCEELLANQVVIQWCDNNDNVYETVVDSLEAAIVAIYEIEAANGAILPQTAN